MRLVKDLCSWPPIFVLNCNYHLEQSGDKMKTIKAICAATLLALSLSVPAYAGDGHNPGSPAPDPADGLPVTTSEDPGSTGVLAVDGETSVLSITDIVWALASMF